MVGRRIARWTAMVTLTATCLAACLGSAAGADEPAAEFMAELRRSGYLEQALLYLDRAVESPLISEDFRQTIALERGLTLIQLSRTHCDPRLRTSRLDEAKSAFDEFLQAQAAHPRSLEARTELGNVLVERANIVLAVAARAQPTQARGGGLQALGRGACGVPGFLGSAADAAERNDDRRDRRRSS